MLDTDEINLIKILVDSETKRHLVNSSGGQFLHNTKKVKYKINEIRKEQQEKKAYLRFKLKMEEE